MKPRGSTGSARVFSLATFIVAVLLTAAQVLAALPGGTLDPTTIPKYVQPLVIPPEMPKSTVSPAPMANYDIAVRQFKQQILPGGIWNSVNGRTDAFPATTIWSYGRAADTLPTGFTAPSPVASGISFNYPAFTMENTSGVPTSVRWINDLVDPVTGNYLPHLFPVDQTLHWANPPKANCAMGLPNRTDCETMIPTPYTGPVPLVTHVHGSHVQPHSDGYPEAWWLPGKPGTKGIPASYGERGTVFTQANNANTVPGSAYYSYSNNQPATTLWYHDHALGMTRLNVYAGPAGFWLVRGGANGDDFVDDGRSPGIAGDGILPGPAPRGAGDPNFDAAYRKTIREVPIAIQDRSFNNDGSLFYPQDRTFFDGYAGPYIGDPMMTPSDISGIWNPEAFFNTMVVNGTTWPKYDVAPALYRLRLLNGCNSRTLNLSMFVVTAGLDTVFGTADDVLGAEVPFYQIGGDQGFLPQVVMITTGFHSTLLGDGNFPVPVAAPDPSQGLLMGPAERADVLVDFSGMQPGTHIRIINTAPDAPFGGLPDVAADPLTTGQVMEFVTDDLLIQPSDATTTPPADLLLPAELPLGGASAPTPRQLSLNELGSDQVCVEWDAVTGAIVRATLMPTDPNFGLPCTGITPITPGNIVEPMGPREAVLGTVVNDGMGNLSALPVHWHDPITENPLLNSTEIWEIFNTTMDAHPIHLHLVRFQVVDRQALDPLAPMGTLVPLGTPTPPLPNELGYKDTVVAYPGQITRVKATFDIAGLYVWHCHIVEHEDNEMMRPFMVIAAPTAVTLTATPSSPKVAGSAVNFTAEANGSGPFEYRFFVKGPTDPTPIQLQAYSAASSALWTTPATVGTYTLGVYARTVGSTAAFEVQKWTTFQVIAPPAAATGATLTVNLASPKASGIALRFTAGGVGGSGSYEYKFLIKGPNQATATVVQAYSTSNVLRWTTPATVGTYTVGVQLRSAGSSAASEAQKWLVYQVVAAAPPATAATLSPNPLSPKVAGVAVKFTAGGVGGSGTYEYQFLVKGPADLKATVLKTYSANNVFTWTTPATLGTYSIGVQVRSRGSNAAVEAQKWITYQVVAPPAAATGATLAASPLSPAPAATVVTFTAGGIGGSGSYEYTFFVKAPGALTATRMQTYSTSNTFLWTAPATVGAYSVGVQVRSLGSAANVEAQKWLTYTIQ